MRLMTRKIRTSDRNQVRDALGVRYSRWLRCIGALVLLVSLSCSGLVSGQDHCSVVFGQVTTGAKHKTMPIDASEVDTLEAIRATNEYSIYVKKLKSASTFRILAIGAADAIHVKGSVAASDFIGKFVTLSKGRELQIVVQGMNQDDIAALRQTVEARTLRSSMYFTRVDQAGDVVVAMKALSRKVDFSGVTVRELGTEQRAARVGFSAELDGGTQLAHWTVRVFGKGNGIAGDFMQALMRLIDRILQALPIGISASDATRRIRSNLAKDLGQLAVAYGVNDVVFDLKVDIDSRDVYIAGEGSGHCKQS